MSTLAIYDSQFGNTAQVARAIAAELEAGGSVRLVAASEGGVLALDGVRLLVVGGPTHRHGVSPAMPTFLDGVPPGALRGVAAAAFATRYRMPRLLSGSAALGIGRTLKRKGARLVAAPESFFIERDVPPRGEKRRHQLERLEPGELERARAWAARLATALAAHEPGAPAAVGR